MLDESMAAPISRSFGCFCSTCSSLSSYSRGHECEELVYLGIILSDLILLGMMSNLLACLHVDSCRLSLHQKNSFCTAVFCICIVKRAYDVMACSLSFFSQSRMCFSLSAYFECPSSQSTCHTPPFIRG